MGEEIEGNYDDTEEEKSSDSESSNSDTSLKRQSQEAQENKNTATKRRVCFKEDMNSILFYSILDRDSYENKKEEKTSDEHFDSDMIRIVFKHSDNVLPVRPISDSPGEIISPSDIYTQYVKTNLPKSILKVSSPVETVKTEIPSNCNILSEVTIKRDEVKPLLEPTIKAITEEVVERTPDSVTIQNVDRPVSRFKAARMTKKR